MNKKFKKNHISFKANLAFFTSDLITVNTLEETLFYKGFETADFNNPE